jgi:hypothetical protein
MIGERFKIIAAERCGRDLLLRLDVSEEEEDASNESGIASVANER